jgi:tellurite resistance protein TehA-like permease
MVDGQCPSSHYLFSPDLGDVSSNPLSNRFSFGIFADNNYRMSSRRHDLEEMTALYLIPIVAIVIAATSGALVAGALTDPKHQLWTLVISYIFWGIGSPLSWIILSVYFLRLMIHKPLQREVVVSLLLPIGPLGLSGFSFVNSYFCLLTS